MISSYTYSLAPTGRRDAVVEDTGRRVDYSYDPLDRLTREQIVDAIFGDRTVDYTYDPVGNRLTMADSTDGVTSYTLDAMDRLTTATLAGDVTQYTYDNNGNMLSRNSATDQVFYTWDFDNRLIAADTNGDGTIDEQNVYDANGMRVSQTVGGQETRFLIDLVQTYPQVALEYLVGGAIKAAYVHGIRLISQARGGVQSFYQVDGLGSTRALTDGLGAVTDRFVYDAFGRILAQSGVAINDYLFAGQQRDPVLGLDYLRARYYDPSVGRFTSADPLRMSPTRSDDFQFYVYGDNDPANRTDPTGLLTYGETTVALAILNGLATGTSAYFRGGRSFDAGINGFALGFFSGLLLGAAFGRAQQLGGWPIWSYCRNVVQRDSGIRVHYLWQLFCHQEFAQLPEHGPGYRCRNGIPLYAYIRLLWGPEYVRWRRQSQSHRWRHSRANKASRKPI